MHLSATPTPRFGSTIIVTGPDKEVVRNRIITLGGSYAVAMSTGPYPLSPNQFRGRVVTDDPHGKDASAVLELMELPFTASPHQAENNAQIKAHLQRLPKGKLDNVVNGYCQVRDAMGNAHHIHLIG